MNTHSTASNGNDGAVGDVATFWQTLRGRHTTEPRYSPMTAAPVDSTTRRTIGRREKTEVSGSNFPTNNTSTTTIRVKFGQQRACGSTNTTNTTEHPHTITTSSASEQIGAVSQQSAAGDEQKDLLYCRTESI